MDYGKLVKRSGIVLLIVSIVLLFIAGLCTALPFYFIASFNNTEDSIAKVVIIFVLVIIIGLLIIIGIISLIFGILYLITSITLLKSGSDINILKTKRKRIIFCTVVLIVSAVLFIIGGIIFMINEATRSVSFLFGLIPLCIGVISLVLSIILIKTIKAINALSRQDELLNN